MLDTDGVSEEVSEVMDGVRNTNIGEQGVTG
jgi:hypothetical protein